MKKFILSIGMVSLLLIYTQPVKAQEKVADKVAGKMFYTELGGPGLIMSMNFDGRFKPKERLGLGYRVGIGFCYGTFDDSYRASNGLGYYDGVTHTYFAIPLSINYVLGKENSAHAFEIGAGASVLTRKVALFCYDADKPGYFIGHVSFMYRIAPINGGFSFRIGFTPMIGTSGDIFPMGALSFGYAF